jgi:hypothetical protein
MEHAATWVKLLNGVLPISSTRVNERRNVQSASRSDANLATPRTGARPPHAGLRAAIQCVAALDGSRHNRVQRTTPRADSGGRGRILHRQHINRKSCAHVLTQE